MPDEMFKYFAKLLSDLDCFISRTNRINLISLRMRHSRGRRISLKSFN